MVMVRVMMDRQHEVIVGPSGALRQPGLKKGTGYFLQEKPACPLFASVLHIHPSLRSPACMEHTPGAARLVTLWQVPLRWALIV